MARCSLILAATLLALLVSVPAWAQWDLLISGESRQLRSLTLIANGYSRLPAETPQEQREAEALADAKRHALGQARAAIEKEIREKNPDVTYHFLGYGPECSLEASVFVKDFKELPAPTPGVEDENRYGVSILAQVAYVIVLPEEKPAATQSPAPSQDPAKDDPFNPPPLELTPSDQPPANESQAPPAQ